MPSFRLVAFIVHLQQRLYQRACDEAVRRSPRLPREHRHRGFDVGEEALDTWGRELRDPMVLAAGGGGPAGGSVEM